MVDEVALGGGDVAEARRMQLADGRVVFAKTVVERGHRAMTTEAAGLRWLRDGVDEADVADRLSVPEVLAAGDGEGGGCPHLVLEWVDAGPGHDGGERGFGRALAALHATGAPCFGRADRRRTGSRGLPNEPCATWEEFYATQRLEPLARIAATAGALPRSAVEGLDLLARRLDVVGPPPEPPARLHGDLWAGNRLHGHDGRSWLVDPAAHGGHREFDLAMMRLFGGFGDDAFDAYEEVSPLADGWQERIALHQLAPLVVHAVKFGGGYVDATRRAVERFR